MGRLFKYLILAGLLWSGWWYVGARGIEAGWSRGLAALRAEGWVAEATLGAVSGYPARFAAQLAGVDLADPRAGWAWRAPTAGLTAQAWNPADLTLDWPAEQRISIPGQRLILSAARGQTRLALIPGVTLAFHRATAAVTVGALSSSDGWRLAVTEARMVVVRADARANLYDLTLDLGGIEPPADFSALADPEARLPRSIDHVTLDAAVQFDAPFNRFIQDRRPQPTALSLRAASVRWGGVEIAASGDLGFDAEGLATGQIMLRTGNWRETLALAVAAGLVAPDYAGTVETGLALFAAASGGAGTLELPFTFRAGSLVIGPIPVGPVPPLRLP